MAALDAQPAAQRREQVWAFGSHRLGVEAELGLLVFELGS